LIVSNQNIKQFPPDFFQIKEREIRSGDGTERFKKNFANENSDYYDKNSQNDENNSHIQNINSFIKPNAKFFQKSGKEKSLVLSIKSTLLTFNKTLRY